MSAENTETFQSPAAKETAASELQDSAHARQVDEQDRCRIVPSRMTSGSIINSTQVDDPLQTGAANDTASTIATDEAFATTLNAPTPALFFGACATPAKPEGILPTFRFGFGQQAVSFVPPVPPLPDSGISNALNTGLSFSNTVGGVNSAVAFGIPSTSVASLVSHSFGFESSGAVAKYTTMPCFAMPAPAATAIAAMSAEVVFGSRPITPLGNTAALPTNFIFGSAVGASTGTGFSSGSDTGAASSISLAGFLIAAEASAGSFGQVRLAGAAPAVFSPPAGDSNASAVGMFGLFRTDGKTLAGSLLNLHSHPSLKAGGRRSASPGAGRKRVVREKGKQPDSKQSSKAAAAAAEAAFSAPISTELAFAIESGQVSRVVQLLEGVENINTLGLAPTQLTDMLHTACGRGRADILSLLLSRGVDVDAKDSGGSTALHIACAGGHLQIASLLLEKGAGVDTEDGPLHVCPTDDRRCDVDGDRHKLYRACKGDHEQAVVQLLEAGAGGAGAVDVNCEVIVNFKFKGKITSRPLLAACSSGNLSLVKYLHSRGADIDVQYSDGSTALHIACAGGHLQIASLLVEKGANIYAKDIDGKTSLQLCPTDEFRCAVQGDRYTLYLACKDGDEKSAVRLLEAGAGGLGAVDIKCEVIVSIDWVGVMITSCPLLAACSSGNVSIVAYLLSGGADIHAKDSGGSTALHIACASGHLQIANLLVEKGANVDTKDGPGKTPPQLCPTDEFRCAIQGDRYKLYQACKDGDEKAVVRLLEARAGGAGGVGAVDINCEVLVSIGSRGETTSRPLLAACSSGNPSLVTYLLSRGASVRAKNIGGATALHIACAGGHLQIASLLIEKGANVDTKDDLGQTPLHIACSAGHLQIASLLVERCANIDSEDGAGKTPLQLCPNDEFRSAARGDRYKLYQACQNGNEQAVVRLLEAGADAVDINCEVIVSFDSNGAKITSRPLVAACSSGNLSLVAYLLRRGANLQAKNSGGSMALHSACAGGHLQIASLLVEKGANVDAKDDEGKTPLQVCSTIECHDAIQGSRGMFVRACKDGDEKAVVRLLEARAGGAGGADAVDINCEVIASFGYGGKITSRPLLAACSSGNRSLVTYLLSRGASVRAKNIGGATALHIACAGGHLQIASLLVEKGANIYAQDIDGKTSLQLCPTDEFRCAVQGARGKLVQACKDGDEKSAVRLLEAGAGGSGAVDVNCEVILSLGINGDHITSRPLLAACSSGNLSLVTYLLSRGADVRAKNSRWITALHSACAGGHLQIVCLLIEKGANVDAIDTSLRAPLRSACSGGHLQIASLLVEKGANLDFQDIFDRTPLQESPPGEFRCAVQGVRYKLYQACMDGDEQAVVRLLEPDAAVDINCEVIVDFKFQGKITSRPLLAACTRGNLSLVAYLLSRGADVNVTNSDGSTALHIALTGGGHLHWRYIRIAEHPQIASLLIEKGANVDAKDNDGKTPLHIACAGGHLQIATLLIDKCANVNAIDAEGRTPLHVSSTDECRCALQGARGKLYQACKDGDEQAVVQLLEAGKGGAGVVDINCEVILLMKITYKNMVPPLVTITSRPLLAACSSGNLSLVTYLLSRGAGMQAKNIGGSTALHSACAGGHLQIASLLIEKGANVNAVDGAGRTPLHVSSNDEFCCAMQGDRGKLYQACKDGDEQAVVLLLEAGAGGAGVVDINCEVILSSGCRGRKVTSRPLLAACSSGNLSLVTYLLSRGADVHVKNLGGSTALHIACAGGHLQIASLLIETGADVDAVDGAGKTPLHSACTDGHRLIASLLFEKGANVEAKDSDGKIPLQLCPDDEFRCALQGERYKLYQACQDGEVTAACALFGAGVDLNGKVYLGADGVASTPLHAASEQARELIISFLIDNWAVGARVEHVKLFSSTLDALNGSTLVSGKILKTPSRRILAILSSTFTDTMNERNAVLGVISTDLRAEMQSRGYDLDLQFVDMRYGVRNENTLAHDTWLACAVEVERCRDESQGAFFISLQADKYGYQMAPKRLPADKLDAGLATVTDSKLCEVSCLKGIFSHYQQMLIDMNSGVKTNVFDNMYDVSGSDVRMKQNLCFLSLPDEFGVDIGIAREDILQLSFKDGAKDVGRLRAYFSDDKVKDVLRKHVLFFESVTVVAFLKYWYRLDGNAFSPYYELRPLCDMYDNPADANKRRLDPLFMQVARPLIIDLLKGIGFEPERDAGILIARSVTEYETRVALRCDESANRCYWFHRSFVGEIPINHEKYSHNKHWDYDDTIDPANFAPNPSDNKNKLDELKAFMHANLPPHRVKEYNSLTLDSLLVQDDSFKAYMDAFQNDFKNVIRGDIAVVGDKYKSWVKNACGLGVGGMEIDEIVHHIKLAQLMASTFEGREDLVTKCIDIATVTVVAACALTYAPAIANLKGIALAIMGVSGSGKTALASYVSQRLKAANPNVPLIIRFCGTSSGSADGFALMRSICLQIHFLFYGGDWRMEVMDKITDYQELVKYFHGLLNQHPLYLVIDSLDQLTNNYKEQSEVSFLKGVDPHPRSRIIVTTLPFDARYKYLCSKRLDASGVPRLDVELFIKEDDPSNATVIRQLAEQVLLKQNRRLTADQWQVFKTSVLTESTALYMNLSTYVMSAWRSYDAISDNLLVPTVPGIIHQIFDNLERQFGNVLMQAVIAYLSFAVEGISDSEMMDLLSLDDNVLKDVFQYSRPDIERLPYHVWLRVKTALGPLIVQREGGAYAWYHRQLKEVGQSRYTEGSGLKMKKYAAFLGRYFGKLVDATVVEKRGIHTHERFLNDNPFFSKQVKVNKRRCVEACRHLIAAEMYVEAAKELCSVRALYAHCRVSYAHCFDYLRAVTSLHANVALHLTPAVVGGGSVSSMNSEWQERVDHYRRFLRLEMTLLAKDPLANLKMCCDRQPEESHVFRDLLNESFLDNKKTQSLTNHGTLGDGIGLKDTSSSVVCKTLGGRLDKFTTLVASLEGHIGFVYAVAVSPDGRWIISSSMDYTMKIWDCNTGECLLTLQGHINAIAVSPDCCHIISGSQNNTVQIWDLITGECLSTFQGHSAYVSSVAASPDGRHVISASGDTTVKIWDFASGECLTTLRGHSKEVRAVALSPDCRNVISGSWDKTLKIWDRTTGECLSTLQGHRYMEAVAVSPDGCHVISGSYDGTVKIWNNTTGECLSTLQGHSEKVTAVAVTPDGRHVISASDDCTVKIWDCNTGECLSSLRGHSKKVTALALSPDGCLVVSGSWDTTVKIWDRTRDESISNQQGHSDKVTAVAVSPDGRHVYSGSYDKTVKIWNRNTGKCLSTLRGHSKEVRAVALSPDGRHVISGSWDSTLKIWDCITGECISTLRGHSDRVWAVAVSPDGRHVISGSKDSTVKAWDFVTGECISTLRGHSDCVYAVAVSPDGRHVISGSEDTAVKIWDFTTGECISTLRGYSFCVSAVAVSPDYCHVISGSDDCTVKVWCRTTGECISTLRGHKDKVRAVAVSPDGRHIISGSEDHTVKIWDRTLGECLSTFVGHSNEVLAVAVSSDGRHVISGASDKTVKIWNQFPHK